jgi:hypothetical protein
MTYKNIQHITTGYEDMTDEELLIGEDIKDCYELEVLISDDNIEFYEDSISGEDREHAIERAKRNWEITVLAKM